MTLLNWKLIFCLVALTGAQDGPVFAVDAKPELLEVRKIWDAGKHNAFTDLIRFQDRFFCVFREWTGVGKGHAGGGDGKVRVLHSTDGRDWKSAALLEEKGIDLRDPKLSITPDQRLMLVAGGSVYEGEIFKGRQPRVAFSSDGMAWTEPKRILSEGDWLWRVTWHKGMAYGVNKRQEPEPGGKWCASLLQSRDGLNWERMAELEVDGRASETTLRLLPDDTMVALMRRSEGDKVGRIGTSNPPYQQWTWHDAKHRRLDGPNFILLPDGQLWGASRSYPGPKDAKTVLARMTTTSYEPVLTLPSGGDCSYPGLVWHDGLLWMSYYSSHEGRTSIYLARIGIPTSSRRADDQQKQADAMLLFDGADRIYLEAPGKRETSFALTELAKRVAEATKQRALVVVIMGKPSRMLPDEQFKSTVDDLEARLRKIGFKRVVFHLASAGLITPIYRE